MAMLKELKEKIYERINRWYYTDEKVIKYLDLGTWAHVSDYEDGITLDYECIDSFDSEELKIIEENEKGSTADEVLGVTVVLSETEICILYAVEAIKKGMFKMNPLIVWSEIMDIGKHEAFHARQYRYLIKKGGLKAIERLSEYMRNVNYEENIIELGAYGYQFFNEAQDFAELDVFIQAKEKPEEKVYSMAASYHADTH